MRLETQATVHYCDGCAKAHIQLDKDILPTGFYVDVMDVTPAGVIAGKLFICSEKCLLRAFRRRHDVWDDHQ